MREALKRWYYAPAYPWEFWLPRSGPIGGVIGGLIFSFIAWVVLG